MTIKKNCLIGLAAFTLTLTAFGSVAPIPGGTDIVTGTSFAAAIVSGAVANLLSASPDLSNDAIEQLIAATAYDLGQTGRDENFGYGLMNYAAALGGINDL